MKLAYLIGMGSNIDPERHLSAAAAAIRERFPEACFSHVYRSPAVGMHGAADFLNACCLLEGEAERAELASWLKGLEDAQGRDRTQGSWRPRTLDLDLLMVGDEVLDDELFVYAHAYVPACELLALPGVVLDKDCLQVISLQL